MLRRRNWVLGLAAVVGLGMAAPAFAGGKKHDEGTRREREHRTPRDRGDRDHDSDGRDSDKDSGKDSDRKDSDKKKRKPRLNKQHQLLFAMLSEKICGCIQDAANGMADLLGQLFESNSAEHKALADLISKQGENCGKGLAELQAQNKKLQDQVASLQESLAKAGERQRVLAAREAFDGLGIGKVNTDLFTDARLLEDTIGAGFATYEAVGKAIEDGVQSGCVTNAALLFERHAVAAKYLAEAKELSAGGRITCAVNYLAKASNALTKVKTALVYGAREDKPRSGEEASEVIVPRKDINLQDRASPELEIVKQAAPN